MHIQAKDKNDLNPSMVKNAVKHNFLNTVGHDIIRNIDVRSFPKKNQFKVFIEVDDREDAAKFFKKIYKQPKLAFFNADGSKLFDREMRAYLIKDEGTYERLAK